MSSSSITAGAIQRLANSKDQDPSFQPVVQIAAVRTVKSAAGGPERYRVRSRSAIMLLLLLCFVLICV